MAARQQTDQDLAKGRVLAEDDSPQSF